MKKKVISCLLIAAMLIGIFALMSVNVLGAGFSDVKASDWYSQAVNYAVSNGLMNGTGNNKFSPNGNMTRAMLVTVLWRYSGEIDEGYSAFSDVANSQWYAKAVAWASQNNIVNGVGNNKFSPNGNITREQMAAILYRFANSSNVDTSSRANLGSFPDGGKVSTYAKEAMQWAVAEGLINGADGKLMPQGNATRAQVATILMRFIQNVVGNSTATADFTVALITDSVITIYDQSYNQACWEGVKEWCSANNAEYYYYCPTENSTDSRLDAIGQAVYDGADAIVLPGYIFGTALIEAQDQYPNVKFIAVDVGEGDLTYDYATYHRPSSNATCITFAEEEAGFLAGYAAVKDGYTKLGFCGGMEVPAVVRYGYGFIQGADLAATENGIDIEINFDYAGCFYGTPELTAEMNRWYANGTEVVFACGGGLFTSVVEAANNYNGKVIGVDVDQSWYDPCIVASATKNLKRAVVDALSALSSGKWSKYSGKFVNLGVWEGNFVGVESNGLPNFTRTQYDTIVSKIANGLVVVDGSYTDTLPAVSVNTTIHYPPVFAPSDSDDGENLKLYANVLRNAMAECLYYSGEAMLYDIDGNGVRELVLMYDIHVDNEYGSNIPYMTCFAYTIENNNVVTLIDGLHLYPEAGGPSGHAGAVTIDGKNYLLVTWESGDTSGEKMHRGGEWYLYTVNGSHIELSSKVEYDYISNYGAVYYGQSSAEFDGVTVDYATYEAWVDSIQNHKIITGYSYESENTLEDMLAFVEAS
ncbi:MAG: BMP family ABC transporter substrate-binding protein [Ruminococcaceae bacterium]|nr:BMP family ABC transporter substrate-binding protein [Oscillospiraceae bacterium]